MKLHPLRVRRFCWGAHPSRVLAAASRCRELLSLMRQSLFRRDAETRTRDGRAPQPSELDLVVAPVGGSAAFQHAGCVLSPK